MQAKQLYEMFPADLFAEDSENGSFEGLPDGTQLALLNAADFLSLSSDQVELSKIADQTIAALQTTLAEANAKIGTLADEVSEFRHSEANTATSLEAMAESLAIERARNAVPLLRDARITEAFDCIESINTKLDEIIALRAALKSSRDMIEMQRKRIEKFKANTAKRAKVSKKARRK